MSPQAVFFDVDFTLIYPGPSLLGDGYRYFCAKHGVAVDPARFERAVIGASSVLDAAQEHIYDAQLFIDYTLRIIEQMGGRGPGIHPAAKEIYQEWAVCQHFSLYDDVEPTLRQIAAEGIRIGLISNTHRSLEHFQRHFELDGLIAGAVSSSEHGFMKPHRSIFDAALALLDVLPGEAVMVGDSLKHDIEGAQLVGMQGVLVRRSDIQPFLDLDVEEIRRRGVTVIHTLRELPTLLSPRTAASP
jgi:HAD superfamily hydrolase (TIGR01549 family)